MADNEGQPKARGRTGAHSDAVKQRDIAVRELIEKERAVSAAKTARLRSLRLDKEAADKASGQQAKTKKPRASRRMKRAPGN